jgi:hypothetical protein
MEMPLPKYAAIISVLSLSIPIYYAITQVLISVTAKIIVSWNVTPCDMLDVYWHFGGLRYLHVHGPLFSPAN